MVIFSQLHTFLIFTLFTSVYRNSSFYNTFGFFTEGLTANFIDPVITKEFPIIIGFMLFNDLLTPLECAMQFVMSLISRTHEYQADAYAKKLGYKAKPMQSLDCLTNQKPVYYECGSPIFKLPLFSPNSG